MISLFALSESFPPLVYAIAICSLILVHILVNSMKTRSSFYSLAQLPLKCLEPNSENICLWICEFKLDSPKWILSNTTWKIDSWKFKESHVNTIWCLYSNSLYFRTINETNFDQKYQSLKTIIRNPIYYIDFRVSYHYFMYLNVPYYNF